MSIRRSPLFHNDDSRISFETVSSVLSNSKHLLTTVERMEADPPSRLQSIAIARNIIAQLETPAEFLARIMLSDVAIMACLRSVIELGILEQLRDADGESISAAELANSRADEFIVRRLLRHLAAMHVLREDENGWFASTPLSNAFTRPGMLSGIVFGSGMVHRTQQRLPEYLQTTGFGTLQTTNRSFQYAFDTDESMFEWMQERPQFLDAFHAYMTVYRLGRSPWTPETVARLKPEAEHLGEETEPVWVVDVGGGEGHHLVLLKETYSEVGRCILQDKADVIALVKDLPEGIDAQIQDFFQPQRVKGAKTYTFQSVFHDWDDEKSLEILQSTREALRPGYSQIMIRDHVVPDIGAGWYATGLDVTMLAMTGGHERTESQWRTLCDQAGLKVTEIDLATEGGESIFWLSLP